MMRSHSEPHQPSRYVQPELSEARVNRLWSSVAERLEQRPVRSWRWLVLGTALAGVAAGAVFFAQSTRAPGAPAHAVMADAKLETKSDSMAVTLVDGSKVQLASHTELSVRGNQPSSVALSLARGQVDCDVAHREGRSFTVVAGDVEVRVVGTQFSVKSTPEGASSRIEVSVLRGLVEIQSARRPGIVARVAAGQSWIQLPQSLDEASAQKPPAAAPASSDSVARAEPADSIGAATSAVPPGKAARELFEKAGERRRSGDAAGAAQAYEELLRLHPGDGRASLSAFELGRLRMDRLGDSAGAIAALERAVALNVGPTFREDALARLVTVYAKQGNFTACVRARDRYLSSHPAGVHAAAVTTRCGTR